MGRGYYWAKKSGQRSVQEASKAAKGGRNGMASREMEEAEAEAERRNADF